MRLFLFVRLHAEFNNMLSQYAGLGTQPRSAAPKALPCPAPCLAGWVRIQLEGREEGTSSAEGPERRAAQPDTFASLALCVGERGETDGEGWKEWGTGSGERRVLPEADLGEQ